MIFKTQDKNYEQIADLGIIPINVSPELTEKICKRILKLYEDLGNITYTKEDVLIEAVCPRFQTGDGKAVLKQSVRGRDLFLLCDVGNYSCTYDMFGMKVPMSPDDHFQDLKRVIQAAEGKAHRITVIMPILYGGRQHKRSARESLDCAVALQELQNMGVHSVVTFDAHDPRVQNATPLMGFDNVIPSYQTLKALLNHKSDIHLDKESFMVVSPDEGAISRNVYYSSVLGVDMGMYYKRRDYSRIVNGRNPIVAHEFLGNDVKGKDIFIYDDIISSGDSMLDIAYDLSKRGARRIFAGCTYALCTEGVAKLQKAVDDGVLHGVLSTNLTYRRPELVDKDWYFEVDVSKYVAYIIGAINHDMSVSILLDPLKKIHALIDKHNAKTSSEQLSMFNK